MYPWVTHTHTHLGGECPHKCQYCYVSDIRFGRPVKYQGPIRLIEKELEVPYRKNKIIFIENCNDLFAEDVDFGFIDSILAHCRDWPENNYVFQTKNPERIAGFIDQFPQNTLIGTTIETNRDTYPMSLAPSPGARMQAMVHLQDYSFREFVTIEPILDFDVPILSDWICLINPEFVNIGADSKGHGLPEPANRKIEELIMNLIASGIEIREKHNLGRFKK